MSFFNGLLLLVRGYVKNFMIIVTHTLTIFQWVKKTVQYEDIEGSKDNICFHKNLKGIYKTGFPRSN